MVGSACASGGAPLPPLQSPPTLEALALQASEDIERIRDAHCAYACLEKLIDTQRTGDCEELCPTRAELGALVRVMNDELLRRVEAAEVTVGVLRGLGEPR